MELLAPAADAVDDGHVLRFLALLGLDSTRPQHLLELERGDDIGQLAVAVVGHPGGVELLVPGGHNDVAHLELAHRRLVNPDGLDRCREVAHEPLEIGHLGVDEHLDARIRCTFVMSEVIRSRAESR